MCVLLSDGHVPGEGLGLIAMVEEGCAVDGGGGRVSVAVRTRTTMRWLLPYGDRFSRGGRLGTEGGGVVEDGGGGVGGGTGRVLLSGTGCWAILIRH